ncbi:MAG: ABC transporter ATP-binding protein [Lachnospiraceae bacterium]
MNAVVVDQLCKQYPTGVLALDHLSLTIRRGEVFTLLGRNGAGKSTLISILTTLSQPTSGSVMILDQQIPKQSINQIRSNIACIAQKVSVDEHLTLIENMKFQGRLYRIETAVAEKRIKELVEVFGLQSYLEYPIAGYSGGVKRRLDIAMNMITSPEILYLDEPTVGMDVFSRKAMWDCIRQIKERFGTTIFLTTHYLEEAELLSDTICIIEEGKKVIQGSRTELAGILEKQYIAMTFRDMQQQSSAKHVLEQHCPEKTVLANEGRLLMEGSSRTFPEIISLLYDAGIETTGIQETIPSLEDIFVQILERREEINQ